MSDEQNFDFRQFPDEFEMQDDKSSYEQKQYPQIDYDNLPINNLNQNISYQKQSNNIKTTQEVDQEKVDYKNLPKLIGNNLQKYLEQNDKQIPKTIGLEKFLNERKKDKDKKKEKQLSTKISDLRQICQSDVQSRRIFKKFIKKQFMIDLIHSTKIEDPLKYIDGISTYFAAADEPDKMISSHIISSKKKFYKT